MADDIRPLEIQPPVPEQPRRLTRVNRPQPAAVRPQPAAAPAPARPQPAAKPPTWSQISSSPKYQALDDAGKESVRQSFWRDVVSPLVPTDELETARAEFESRTKPSLTQRAGAAVQDALAQRQAPTDLPDVAAEATPEPPQPEPAAPPPAAMPARLRAQQDMGSAEVNWFGDDGVFTNSPAGMVAAGKNAAANLGAMSFEEARRQSEAELLTGRSPAERAATYSTREEQLRVQDPHSEAGFPTIPQPQASAERTARLRAATEQARAAGEDYKKWAEQTRKELELVTPKGEMSTLQQGVWSFVQSAPPTLLGISVGILTRNPAAAMALAGGGGSAFQAGSTYGEAIERGASHEMARRAALIDGVLEGVGEAIPLRVALKPGSPFLKRLAQTIGEEAGQEGITQLAQDLNAYTSYNPNITLQEAWQNFKVALLAGAVAGTVYGAAGAAADTARDRVTTAEIPPAAPGAQPPGAPPAAPPQAPAPIPEDPAGISRMIAGEDPAAMRALDAEQALGREEAQEGAPEAPAEPAPETAAPEASAQPAAPAPAVATETPPTEPATPPAERPTAPAAPERPAESAGEAGPEGPAAPPPVAEPPPPPPGSRPGAGAAATTDEDGWTSRPTKNPKGEADGAILHMKDDMLIREVPGRAGDPSWFFAWRKGPTSTSAPVEIGSTRSLEEAKALFEESAEAQSEAAGKLEKAAKGLKGIFESKVDEGAHEAASSPTNDKPEPTKAQIEANNAELGHTRVATMPVSIENPQGAVRRDIHNTPPKWEVTMKDHYGYLPGTIGYDKDHLDVFIKPGTREDWPGDVYVVNQNKDSGQFDEHKAMVGYQTEAEAGEAYLRNYDDSAKARARVRGVTKLRLNEFKAWAYDKGPNGPRGGPLEDTETADTRELPMMEKGKSYRGVPSAKIAIEKRAGRWWYDLSLQTNVSGIGTGGGPYESQEAALEGAVERGLTWAGKDVNMASEAATGPHRRHIARMTKWLEEQKPKKGGPDASGNKGPSVRGKAQAQEGEPGLRDLPGGNETELRDGQTPEAGERGAGAAAPAPAERGEALPADEVARLVNHTEGAIEDGRFPSTISEARAWASDVIQKPIRAGTRAAKQFDEAIEQAIVKAARKMVAKMEKRGASTKEIYMALVELYKRQPNLAVRTSTSIREQAYSTPVPLAYIASRLALVTDEKTVLEPTAGNGMLLIEANPEKTIANELNDDRAEALRKQGFTVTQRDAAEPGLRHKGYPVDVVIANPPFGYVKGDDGRTKDWKLNAEYTTNQVDHAIAIRSLETMKDDGSAVLIVAAPNKLKEGESRQDAYNGKAMRAFYYTLYRDYNVVDQFTVAGDLYSKQGAAWPVDVVVIRGKGPSSRPLPAAELPRIYASWGELQEKTDERYASRSAEDRRPGEDAARGELGAATRDEAGGEPAGGRAERPAAGPAGQGRPGPVRGRPVPEQPDSAGLAPTPGTAGIERSDGGQPGGAGEPADVGRIFDEEFAAAFGEVTQGKAEAYTPASAVAPGPEGTPSGPARTSGEAAASAARESGAAMVEIAKGLDKLFGGKGRVGSGLQFDEETYAKAKPHFVAALQHFRQAGQDIREAVRLLIQYLRQQAGMTAEAIHRMKPYVVRFMQDVQEGRIAELRAPQRPTEAETEHQVAYEPGSKSDAIGTLIPVNMRDATQSSLTRLKAKVGELDDYVATELGYSPSKIGRYFSAEQVDALAMAIAAIKAGSGFIIGDQTGVGKGRVVAGIIRYALRQGKTAIFSTEKPNLYKDIYRDLADIGMPDVNPIMTNGGQAIPLTDDGDVVLKSKASKDHNALLRELVNKGNLGENDMVFTTYSQMQTIKGGQRTARMDFLEAFGRGAVLILDESHNAGGNATAKEDSAVEKDPTRADFVRALARLADSVFYSSATYAKRPEVMDLYFKTDMSLAVDSPAALPAAIRAGGVPLQQVVASMLAKAGQYIRRERSFAGVTYNTQVTPVNREVAEKMSSVMRRIAEFDTLKASAIKVLKAEVRAEAKTMTEDGSVGMAGVQSTNFTSLMHNMVDQMLLALKVIPAADMAIAAARRGEKPVLTVSNTMGSFIQHYITDHNLNPGDAINISFGDLLMRYLERSRDVVIGNAFGKKTRHRLTDEELGPFAAMAWNSIRDDIQRTDFSQIPLSPIDYLKSRILKEGLTFGEITGRQHLVDYTGDVPTYRLRPGKEISIRGRNETITAFNKGDLDTLLINQAGSTGLSLHASSRFKDKRKRHMMIVQPERNIDTHMQMLGRVNRTGQVVPPEYTQLVADIPAEKRPAAVLAKKMASLNANTTAARGSALTSKEVVDFMNVYGDEVVAQLMEDNPEWHRKMGSPLAADEEGVGLEREDAIRRVTGRIPLLNLREQEDLYDLIESEYLALIDEKDRMGENALEAKTLPLEAKVKKVIPVTEGKGGDSPFAAGSNAEIVDVRRLGKPYTSAELLEAVRISLGQPEGTSLTNMRTAGNIKVNGMREQLESDFQDYLGQELDSLIDQRHRDATKLRLETIHRRLDSILAQSHIGRPVELHTRFGTIPAVVTNVEVKGKPKNPAAMGSWKITYAVADAVRHITLPASRLTTPTIAHAGAIDAGLVQIEDYRPADHGNKKVQELFDDAQSISREDRTIMTGNLLAAFGKFPNGRIINYTTDDGRVQQGILMPAKFDLDSALNAMPVEFPNARTAIEFLASMSGQPVLESVDEKVFRVAKIGGEDLYRFSVAAARDKGGIIYLSPQVLEAAGQDFVKAGTTMRLEVPKDKAIAVLQAMMDSATQRVHTNAYRQEAKDFLAKQEPVVRAAPSQSVPEARWLAVDEIQQKVDELTRNLPHKPYIGILGRPSEVFAAARVPDWVPGFTVNQKIYLARSGLASLEDVEVVTWHELFHYGVRRFMTKEQYIAAMDRLYRSNSEVAKRADAWLEGTEGRTVVESQGKAYGRARAVDEALAALSEQLRGMTEEQIFSKASPLDSAIMAIVRWAADIAERFGATRVAARIRAYTNEDAIRFVGRIFSRLAMNEAAVSGPGAYPDTAFALRPSAEAQARRREELARASAKDTSLTDKILSAPFKLAKWDAMAEAGWEKVRELNERATEAYPAWEAVRAGVESDYGLEEQYLDRRVQMQVHLQKWARGAKNLIDQLGALTREESRVAYEWMHDRNADELIDDLPEDSKNTLRSIKELIRSLGQEAVRLGQLSKEVFERNELAYLHRSYLKHEFEKTIAARLGNRKAIAVWAEQYKGRGLKDWRTLSVLNSMAREALDPREMKGKKFYRLELRGRVPQNAVAHLEAMSGHRPLGKLRKAIYWPEGKAIPNEYATWHNDGLWEVRWNMGGKWGLWRDLSKSEREALGEIDEVRFGVAKTLHLMTHDIEIGRMQEWVAETYGKAELEAYEKPFERSAAESLASTYGKMTWVKVPSTEVRGTNVKKYGALAGKYIPGPVWNDIRQHVSLDTKAGALRQGWETLLRIWKINKTALSPGVHMNNVMANVFIADFHDLRSKDLIKAIRVLLDARLSKSPNPENAELYQRFEDSGALHGMFKYHELKAEVLDPLLDDIRKQSLNDEDGALLRTLSIVSWLNAIHTGGKVAANAMIEAYGAEDEVFRLAVFIKSVRNGYNDIEAGRLSRKAFLDYDINAPWIQALRRTAFPFIAFPYRAIPMMIDTFTHKPWKLIKYVALAAILDELAYAWLGLDDKDEERERRMMPEEKSGKIWGLFPKLLRMPWNRDGNPVFLDVRRWFPSGDIFDTAYTHAAIPWSPAALPGGPLALLAELMTNRASFTGQDITLETDTGWEKSEKLGMHLYRFFMPNLFMIPGTWSFEGIRGALGMKEAGPQTDVFGREFSLPQALGSAFGVKVGTYPEDVLRYNLIRRHSAQEAEIMGNIYKAVGDAKRKRLSEAELRDYVKEQMEKIRTLREQTAKRVRPPESPRP